MKLYMKKEELDLIQRIAYLSETAARFEALGKNITDIQFKKLNELTEKIYNLAKELERIHNESS